MDFSTLDNSVINEMAVQFTVILIVMLAVGFAFGLVLKVIKAPHWLYKPIITLGVFAGMYFVFKTYMS